MRIGKRVCFLKNSYNVLPLAVYIRSRVLNCSKKMWIIHSRTKSKVNRRGKSTITFNFIGINLQTAGTCFKVSRIRATNRIECNETLNFRNPNVTLNIIGIVVFAYYLDISRDNLSLALACNTYNGISVNIDRSIYQESKGYVKYTYV